MGTFIAKVMALAFESAGAGSLDEQADGGRVGAVPTRERKRFIGFLRSAALRRHRAGSVPGPARLVQSISPAGENARPRRNVLNKTAPVPDDWRLGQSVHLSGHLSAV